MNNIINEQTIRKALKKYCNEVNKYYKAGNIESSYNKPVIDLIQTFGCSAHDFSGARSGITGENIDIKLWHIDEDINTIPPFGAIEVKKVNGEDSRARTQILIEAQKFGNVILTDNVTWKFYNSESEKMYNGFVLLKKNNLNEFELDETKIDLFIATIRDFVLEKPNNIRSSSGLAYYMSEYAKTIKTIVFNILQADNSKAMYNELLGLYTRIRQELLPDLEYKEFADMYAQTIVYGLFIARYNDKTTGDFTRGEAIENLAKESHLLKQFFQHIATSENLHPTLNEAINKLCELYSLANLKELLNQYEKKDAIVHFYEDFLTYYDLEQKKSFGAYYTPVSVVRFIINMVDEVLINDFNISNGLANNNTTTINVKCDPYTIGTGKKQKTKYEKDIEVPEVAILDPACGTGTFGAEIIKYIKDKYFSNGNEVFYKDWLENENGLMQRLISFEIMMTSYVIAHLKIRKTLMETLNEQILDKKLPSNIFLTNTLAEPKSIVERNSQISFFDFSGAITEEAENADQWKCRRPIQVIIGNPPYLYSSKNTFNIDEYRFETDGITKLNERNPKGLNDDYVKFIRFAEQHIQKDGKGILAFITNNGYLDNPTFRGMRASLLRTFDKIYILNLHGNSIKKETAPDGSKDENVFDIRIGVSIIIAIKKSADIKWSQVKYAELYGTRNNKFKALDNNEVQFIDITPDKEKALFIPQISNGMSNYEQGISLLELFPATTTGIDTGNDEFALSNDKNMILNKIDIIKNAQYDNEILELIGKLYYGQTIEKLKYDVKTDGNIVKVDYRPFEQKYTYYTGISGGWLSRPRDKDIMMSLNKIPDNFAITYQKQGNKKWRDIFVAKNIIDSHYIGSKTYIAPFILNIDEFTNEKIYNINENVAQTLTQNLNRKIEPKDIFDYCYGILNNPQYIKENNDFLIRDCPRIPIIENEIMFKKYVEYGSQLRELHLMKNNIQKELTLECCNNNLLIENVKYQNGKLNINKETSILGITEDVYNYYLGGYQVIDKWLKSHKGENLTIDSFNHIKKIVGIIEETIKIQEKLEKE